MPGICQKHGIEQDKWYHCAQCKSEYYKKYALNGKTKQWQNKYRSTAEGKLRKQARAAIRKAIHSGLLVKQPCVVCGNFKSETHHAWSYKEDDILNVIFLCRKHHRQADSNPVFNEKLKSDFPPCV